MLEIMGTVERPMMILACSGCSYVGQLANRAAVELSREGFGKMSCLAALGAHLESYLQSARLAPALVAINGCEVGCVAITLEHLGIVHGINITLTETGIAKKNKSDPTPEDMTLVKDFITSRVKSNASNTSCGCDCCS